MKVILRQALIAVYVATTIVALADFFIWMTDNNGREPASEPPAFGELSTGCRNHLAWAPTAAARNDAASRPRNVA
jgi:hypothetical protein